VAPSNSEVRIREINLGHRSTATLAAGSTVKWNNTTVAAGGSPLEPLADVWDIMSLPA
jgi:hypothetical protein